MPALCSPFPTFNPFTCTASGQSLQSIISSPSLNGIFSLRRTERGELIESLPELMQFSEHHLQRMLSSSLSQPHIAQMIQVLHHLPQIEVGLSVSGVWEGGSGKQETRPLPQDSGNLSHNPLHFPRACLLHASDSCSFKACILATRAC